MMLAQAADVSYWKVFILGGGTIGYIIILLSVVMLSLAIKYLLEIRRVNILPEAVQMQVKELFDAKQYREAIDMTSAQPDYLSYLINSSLAEAPHGYPAMERALEEASEERTTKMLRSIEWLNVIGNIAPMMGLLGTVVGMILAFFSIVAKGGMPNPGDLAGSIGIALVTTMQGLIVAIPALALYAALRNRIDAMSAEAMKTAQELVSTFRPARKAQ